jgi:hypothetical protein
MPKAPGTPRSERSDTGIAVSLPIYPVIISMSGWPVYSCPFKSIRYEDFCLPDANVFLGLDCQVSDRCAWWQLGRSNSCRL